MLVTKFLILLHVNHIHLALVHLSSNVSKLWQKQYVSNVNKFKSISLSLRTVARRIEKLGDDFEERQLLLKTKNFITFSLALDESTDIINTAQLAIFICGAHNLCITEELLNIIHLKDTTTGEDILSSVEEAVESINLS